VRAGGVEPPSLIADGLQPFELADAQHPQNSFLFICFAFSAAEFVFLFEPAIFLFQSFFGSRFLIRCGPHFYFIYFDVSFRFLFQRFIIFFPARLNKNLMKSLVSKPGYTYSDAH